MPYIELLTKFTENEISVDDFQDTFLEKYKSEPLFSYDSEFSVLDTLFGQTDAYCPSDSEEFDLEEDVDEEQLRETAKETLKFLLALNTLKIYG